MSEWDNGTYDPNKKKTNNRKQTVSPHIDINDLADLVPMLDRLVATTHVISVNIPAAIARVLPDTLRKLDSYYQAKWRDYRTVFIDLRFDKGHGEKSFRIFPS